jgi:gamma-glutamyl:cysteine ligase YbdK (ATP-grasp superfamily)
VCAPAAGEVDCKELQAKLNAARDAGVAAVDLAEGVTKLAQAKRWHAARDGLAAALMEPTTEREVCAFSPLYVLGPPL